MEIKTAFRTLVGILMIATVTIATVAIVGNLIGEQIFVKACIPKEYTTTDTISDDKPPCGLNPSGQYVFCNENDKCMDSSKNKCCLTSDPDVEIYMGRCCEIK